MATPRQPLDTLSPELSTFFQYEYAQAQSSYIGTQILPITNVGRQAGDFGVIPLNQLAKHNQTGERAPGAGYDRDEMDFTKASFSTSEYGFEEVIDRREGHMYSGYLNAPQVATARLVNKFLTAFERRAQAKVMEVSQYGARTSSPGTKWDAASSDPVGDVEVAFRAFRSAFGMEADTLIMDRLTFRDLRNNAQIQGLISSSGAGDQNRSADVTLAQLQQVFDLPKILVGGGMRNSANAGAPASMVDIWSDNVLLTKTANSSDMREPCIGRTFHWSEDGSSVGGTVEAYYAEENRSDIVRIRGEADENIIYPGLGYLLTNVAAGH